MSKRYRRRAQVLARYGDRSEMWLHRKIKAGEFPPPAFYDGRFPYWDEADLDRHDAELAAKSATHRPVLGGAVAARNKAERAPS